MTGEALGELRSNGTLPDALGMSLQHSVGEGQPLSEAMRRFPDKFPGEDVALIEAGETTGRLDGNLDRLARYRDERSGAQRALLLKAIYPVALGHLAAFMLPIAHLALKQRFTLANWMVEVASLLVPFWGIVFLVRYLHGFAVWRDRFRKVIDLMPGFGGAARHRRRALFASVLEAAYEAGIPMERSLALAARAAHEPRADGVARAVSAGQPLNVALTGAGVFAPAALSRVANAEEAGEIGKALHFIANEEAEKADDLFKGSMIALGMIVSIVVMGWIAWGVISFYANLYSGIGDYGSV